MVPAHSLQRSQCVCVDRLWKMEKKERWTESGQKIERKKERGRWRKDKIGSEGGEKSQRDRNKETGHSLWVIGDGGGGMTHLTAAAERNVCVCVGMCVCVCVYRQACES